MATHLDGGDNAEHLSAAAKGMYGAITRQEWDIVHQLQAEHPNALAELNSWGLVTEEHGRPVACDPEKALPRKLESELDIARRRVARMARIPDLTRELARDFQASQLRAAGNASVYVCDPAIVNARLQDIVGTARREILAAQPGGPRTRELFDMAVSRDSAALDRGVSLRTIYRDTVRDHTVTAEYARTMATRTSGRPAQYRTLGGDFERMIIVDRETAIISDHIVEGSPPHSAWLVTDPAVVAVFAAVYDSAWRRAIPWTGELRASRGRTNPVQGPDGVRTTARQREIMRLLCGGVSQSSTATKVGVSRRKLEGEIADLKALWGVRTLNELIYQYATSPDCLLGDGSAPEARPAGAEETAA